MVKLDYFPSVSRFRRNGAPERRSPTKTKVATLHRYKIVVGGLDGQDPQLRRVAGFNRDQLLGQ